MPQLDTFMYSSIIFFLWIFLLIFTEVIFLFLKYIYTPMRTKALYLRNLYTISSKTYDATEDINKMVLNHAVILTKQLNAYLAAHKAYLDDTEKKLKEEQNKKFSFNKI